MTKTLRLISIGRMRRINKAFINAKSPLLNIYFTAGFPELDDTVRIIKVLQDSGVDIIEIGIPYSDPIADGETIQASSAKALENGMSIPKLFNQLENIRSYVDVPIVLMGYLNPIMQYGVESFCKACQEVGIDGLIIPDLPMELFDSDYRKIFRDHGLDFIFLITPETPPERARMIDERSTGFIYMVSASSTTGKTGALTDLQLQYFQRIKAMELSNPLMVGFGISDHKTFTQSTAYAEGAIVGSAFIKQLQVDSSSAAISKFIERIKGF